MIRSLLECTATIGETFLKLVEAALITFIMTSSRAHAAVDGYDCVADQTSGVRFDPDSKSWKAAIFPSGHKYRIAPPENGKCSDFPAWEDVTCPFIVTRADRSTEAWVAFSGGMFCEKDFDSFGYLYCKDSTASHTLAFNKKNGRFLLSAPLGYVSVLGELNNTPDEKGGHPFLEIGNCSLVESPSK